MKKKMLGLLIAAAIVVSASMSTSMPVFALPTVTSGNAVTTVSSGNTGGAGVAINMAGDIKSVAINVTVTSVNQVVINPYGVKVTYSTIAGSGNTTSSNDTLIIEPIKFVNNSKIPVAVDLKGKIELPKYTGETTTTYPTANRVTVAASEAAIKTAATKQVFVKATFASENKKLADNPKVFYYGATTTAKTSTGTTTTTKFTKAADVVYTVAGSAALANPPILAATDDGTSDGRSKELYVIFTGGASVNPTSAWDTEKDKIELKTTYDLQYVGESKVISRFATDKPADISVTN